MVGGGGSRYHGDKSGLKNLEKTMGGCKVASRS